MNSNLFFTDFIKEFQHINKLFLHAIFWNIKTKFGGLKTNSGLKMTISCSIRLILVAIDEFLVEND